MRRIFAETRSTRPIILFLFLMVITASVSCVRAPDLPNSSEVIVTITPSIATIRVGGTIDLQGEVTGLSDPTINFWQQEQNDAGINGSEDCDFGKYAVCPFGYLTGLSYIHQGTSAVATYHAPPTPGTYRVVFHAFQISKIYWTEQIEKHAFATIVVTY